MLMIVAKAEQLGLFDMPVQVAGSVDKLGHVRRPHMSTRKKRLNPETHHAPVDHVVNRLDAFILKHGGPEHLRAELEGMTAEQRAKLIDAMAHVGEISHVEVMARLGMQEAPEQKIETPPTVVSEPKEGDTKTEDGVEYVLRDSRWHRAGEESSTENTAVPHPINADVQIAEDREDLADEMMRDPHSDRSRAMVRDIAEKETASSEPPVATELEASSSDSVTPPRLLALRAKIEELGGREKVATAISAHPERMASLIDGLTELLGVERSEVEAELGVSLPETGDASSAESESVFEPVADDMNPNSPNYRYRDTGHVAGSRKEMAAQQIRSAGKSGTRLRATDVDWDQIEQNPREAKQLITKSNLFGTVEWELLRVGGMLPAAGYLLDRVYASIGTEPSESTPQARRDYALGLETLRDRMEKCHTPEQITDVLKEIQDEIAGEILNANESEAYKAAYAEYLEAHAATKLIMDRNSELASAWAGPQNELRAAEYEQEKRLNRKWKADPELAERIIALRAQFEAANKVHIDFRAAHPELETKKRDHGNGYQSYDNDLEFHARGLRDKAMRIREAAKRRNVMENPLTRAWMTLGSRFIAVVDWRRHKGSDAFASHVTAAKNGKIKDWSWSEKKAITKPPVSKRQVSFQLRVAESFTRHGGRDVSVDSTEALKSQFGLREVQSGNWVLSDVNSAAFHVQRAAEAMADMADIIGVADEHLAVNGRIAIAFGARGHGNAGFKGAARAHYESVQRVVNLTKMSGGGALGHELFHAIDNLVKEAEGGGESGKDEYLTENPDFIPAGELRDAFRNLRSAIMTGPHRLTERFLYTDKDHRLAKHNIDSPTNDISRGIKSAADASEAVLFVQGYYARRYGDLSKQKRLEKQFVQWRKLAVAYHDGNAAGAQVDVPSGPAASSFVYEATKLDQGTHGKYWSQGRELAARAFQSFCEDKLESQGRKNDYLSVYADNKYHVDPLFGPIFPYPDGEERKRINGAFENLFAVMARRGTLAKALGLL